MTGVSRIYRQAPSTLTDSEMEALRRKAWLQGVLSVDLKDMRLTWPEVEMLKQIGRKLYGKE